ncbi:MAG: rod shape-determining protein MreD [Gemmatimonadota bacterium]
MRLSLLTWAVVISLPILHFLLHVGLGLGPWAPDLLTVGLLVLAREVRPSVAAGAGFVFGLLEDAFSILAFGTNTVALTVVGILGARSRDLFVGESLVFLVSYLALGVWLRYALQWLVSGSALRGPAAELLFQAPLAAVYSAGVGILILRVSGIWREERAR